jgi:hypothetical protein
LKGAPARTTTTPKVGLWTLIFHRKIRRSEGQKRENAGSRYRRRIVGRGANPDLSSLLALLIFL